MYKQLNNPDGTVNVLVVLRTTDFAYIPFDEANTDYQEYLKWLSEGNEPLPAEQQ